MVFLDSIQAVSRRWWAVAPVLVVVSVILLGGFGLSLVGLIVDPRLIGGEPAWLKPAKFAISIPIFCLTIAWLTASVSSPSRPLRGAGVVIGVILLGEYGIVAGQAARGTTSHFNVETPLDSALFGIMGIGILGLLLASVVVAVELFRAPFADRAWGAALRWGMLITVLGSLTGGLMIRPTTHQIEQAKRSGAMPNVGQHTVGGRDGGQSLPGVGWSRDHGDLRAPHFFGLHAVQAVPLVAWLLLRMLQSSREGRRLALVRLVALSYAGLIGLLTLQAMAGRPIFPADQLDVLALAGWLGISALVGAVILAGRSAGTDRNPLTLERV